MSTKIYHGYKINLPTDQILPLLVRFHRELRDSDWNQQQVTLSQAFYGIEYVIKLFDLSISIDSVYRYFKSMFDDHVKYSIAIIPKEKHTLAIVWAADQSVLKQFSELPEVDYYGYWDNSDPPEDVSPQEWEERCEEWKCIPYGAPVCKVALIWEPFTRYDFPDIGALSVPYDPDKLRETAARFIKSRLKLDMPVWRLKWKIPLLTKQVLFSNSKLLLKGE